MSEIEYSDLLFEISTKIGAIQLERLVFMCRNQISKGSARTIQNPLGLFEELEKRNNLGIDRLETLKQILTQLKNRSMLKKVEEFEIKRKAQSVGIIASLKQAAVNVKGAIKMVCNFRTIGGALLVVGSGMALHSCSTLDEFVETFNKVVLVSYTKLIEISEGSLCFTVQAETPAALKELWDIYKDGTLQSRLQEFLVTDDVKHLANGENVEMTVFINEQEYKEAYLDLLQKNLDVPDIKEEERLWRNSDSFLCSKLNEDEVTLLKLKQMENKLSFERKFHEEEIMKLKEKIVLTERLSGEAAACVKSVAGWIQARSVESVLVLAENLKRAITLVCNFRTVAGGFLTVNSDMALRKCSSRQDYQETFERVVLPSSNKLIEISNGSIRFVVEAEKLAALKELWDIYKDGTLQSRLQEFLVTDEIKQLANGEDIKVTVSIDEHEYKEAYFNFFLLHQAPNVEQEERAGRRPRRNSDSFLCFKPNENEIALKRLMEETEEKWRKEKEILELRITELEETLKAERTSTLNQTTTLGRPLERRRRNSDSDLYYKARKREVEQTENEPERAFEDGAEMDFDKRMFVENYLRNIHETHSMTTETSDSGITTHGLTAEIEMQDISDGDRKLCLKDLNEDVIRRLSLRLMSDEAALEQILQSFGIDFPGTSSKMKGGTDIFSMFPDTPVKVLREVFEALQLYDLIDLLEEGKPRITRSLRHALPLQDMERLRNPGDRPMSYHSSVAVLIIDSSKTSDTVGIKKFFKGLNTKSEVTVIPYKKYATQNKKEAELKYRIFDTQRDLEQSSSIFKRLRGLTKKEEYLKEMEENLKEKEENLKEMEENLKEMEEMERAHCRSIISEVIQNWISNQDEFTLFAVFLFLDHPVDWFSPMRSISDDIMERLVTAFPTKGKLVIHPEWDIRARGKKPHKEVVEVSVDFKGDDFPTLMLDVFTKRWQTMDLLSMMRELKRTLGERQLDSRDVHWREVYRGIPRVTKRLLPVSSIQVQDNLSCLLRFVMHEEPTNE